MEIIRLCKSCGHPFKLYSARVAQNRGIYCSKKCKFIGQYKTDDQKLATFTKKYNKTPEELTRYLQSTKTTLTRYSTLINIPIGTLSKDFQNFGVKAYKIPFKKPSIYICQVCGNKFLRFERISIKGRIKYCSTICRKASRRRFFRENLFRIKNFNFFESKKKAWKLQ